MRLIETDWRGCRQHCMVAWLNTVWQTDWGQRGSVSSNGQLHLMTGERRKNVNRPVMLNLSI